MFEAKKYIPGLGVEFAIGLDELSAAVQALLALPGTLSLIDLADGKTVWDDAGAVVTDSQTQAAVAAVPALIAFLAAIPTANVPSPGIWLDAGILTLGTA